MASNDTSPHAPGECKKLWQHWGGLFDGELTPEERRGLEAHLAECGHCRGFYESQAEFSRALKQSLDRADQVPAALRSKVLHLLDHAEGHEHGHDHEHDHGHHHHDHAHGLEHDHGRAHAHGPLAMGVGSHSVRMPLWSLVMLSVACVALGALATVLVQRGETKQPDPMMQSVVPVAKAAQGALDLKQGAGGWNEASATLKKLFPGHSLPRGADGAPKPVNNGVAKIDGRDVVWVLYCTGKPEVDERERFVLMMVDETYLPEPMRKMQFIETEVDGAKCLMWRDGTGYWVMITRNDRKWLWDHQKVLLSS